MSILNGCSRAVTAASLCLLACSTAAEAGLVNLGTAGNYAVLATGTGLTMNSGPIVGDVLMGQGAHASFAGGGNGQITGKLYYDSTVTGTNTFNQLNTPPTTQLVTTAFTLQAQNDAIAASNAAALLAPTQTFGALTGTVTINGNGGLNVIKATSLSNATVTLNGSANDVFIFNFTGLFATNRPFILAGGVTATHLLFNMLGTGTVFQTAGGNTLYGTFLATRGGSFHFSNLNLTGALINTGGGVDIVSGSHVTYADFLPTPGAVALLGLGGLFASRRRR